MGYDRLHQILLVEAEIAEPVFALSWLITWFAHDLQDPVQVCRLYDLYAPIYSSMCNDLYHTRIAEHAEKSCASLYLVPSFLIVELQIPGVGPPFSATVLCSRADRAPWAGAVGLAAPGRLRCLPPLASHSTVRLANGRACPTHGCADRGSRYGPTKSLRSRGNADAFTGCPLGIVSVPVV